MPGEGTWGYPIDSFHENVDYFEKAGSSGAGLFGSSVEIEGSERKGLFMVVSEHARGRAPEHLGLLGVACTLDCHAADRMQAAVTTLSEGTSR